jgi:hypothetical protein
MGPFADYQNTILPRRLDGSLWSDPPWVAYALGPFYVPVYDPPSVPYATTGSYGGVHDGRRAHGRTAADLTLRDARRAAADSMMSASESSRRDAKLVTTELASASRHRLLWRRTN